MIAENTDRIGLIVSVVAESFERKLSDANEIHGREMATKAEELALANAAIENFEMFRKAARQTSAEARGKVEQRAAAEVAKAAEEVAGAKQRTADAMALADEKHNQNAKLRERLAVLAGELSLAQSAAIGETTEEGTK